MNAEPAGRVEDKEVAQSLLLLTTQNRYSGKPETTLLTFRMHGDTFVIAASNETEHYKPDWYLNLKEEPVVIMEVNGASFHARAVTPVGTDRLEVWPLVDSLARHNKNILPRNTSVVVLTPMC